jgi:hypothetical protein
MESSGTVSSLAVIGFWSGLLGCILLVVDGPLYRAHALGLGTALRIVIPAALFLGVIAILLSVIGLMRSGSKGMAVAGLVLGVIAAGMPLKSINTARHSPIHDVNTDRDNPPQFVAVLPLRARQPRPQTPPTMTPRQPSCRRKPILTLARCISMCLPRRPLTAPQQQPKI